jgi:tetratricopeptide (TPR) repeat protein
MPLPPEITVAASLGSARSILEHIRNQGAADLDFSDQYLSADVLRAVCQALLDDCATSPHDALHAARELFARLELIDWKSDEFGELTEILCTLSFAAWRAARVADNTLVAQGWEAQYLRLFRGSLQWDVTKATWGFPASTLATEDQLEDGESVFQALFYLRDALETMPRSVQERALEIHEGLVLREGRQDLDLETFFLGESARIVGCAKRNTGQTREAEDWLERAETHFLRGPSPAAQLTRLKANRLAILYQLNHWETVCRAAPVIDEAFAEFGMEEDRVKWGISRAASLKVAGRLEEALDVLKPFRENWLQIPRSLSGWVLLQVGDIHQILGDHELAMDELCEAAQLLRETRQFTGLAQVSAVISFAFRSKGMFKEALRFLQISRADLEKLCMKWSEAYCRMLIAETYLAMGRPHDAETEIRAAIPVFEDEGMVADAVVAVSLLREAIRRQKLEPRPVVDIRDRFRPKK